VIREFRLLRVPNLGTTIPNMGIEPGSRSALAEALFSTVQLRVLGLLFGQPDRSFQGAELIRLARSGAGAVHRVLTRLAATGLVSVTPSGNQKHYRANEMSPIFTELHGLIVKTVGLAAPLQAALAPFADQISGAFVYGSVAKGSESTRSDIDLMIIGDGLDYAALYQALQPAEATLGRVVNPTIYGVKEFNRRKRTEGFVERVLHQPKLWVIGSDHAIT
jgi:predicted nucleotidyltransferase